MKRIHVSQGPGQCLSAIVFLVFRRVCLTHSFWCCSRLNVPNWTFVISKGFFGAHGRSRSVNVTAVSVVLVFGEVCPDFRVGCWLLVVVCCFWWFFWICQKTNCGSICQGSFDGSRTKVRRLTSLSWFKVGGAWPYSVNDRDFSLLNSVKCDASWITSHRDSVRLTQRSLRQHHTWHMTYTTHDTPQHTHDRQLNIATWHNSPFPQYCAVTSHNSLSWKLIV